MYCRNCGKEMDDKAKFCVTCGCEKGVGTSYCQNCGKETAEEAQVCTSCGVALKTSSKGSSADDGAFHRVRKGKLIAGVCTGIGRKTETSAWLWRVLFVVFGCCFLGVAIYVGMICAFKYADE